MTDSLGIIGTGEIAEAIVDGLRAVAAQTPTIQLSPRNARIAQALADRHANVQVCKDNQAVVDSAAVVLLAVRPDVVATVLAGLRVPDDRVLISAVAGWSIDALREQLGANVTIVRAIPLPAVRHRSGVTAIYPADPVAEELFNRLGGTLVAPNPRVFDALSASTAAISSYLHYLDTIAHWVARQGLEARAAEGYVSSMFLGVNTAMADQRATLAELGREHETPGGLNETLRAQWFTPENQAALDQALDTIRLRVAAPPT